MTKLRNLASIPEFNGLEMKEAMFIIEYLKDLNAPRAAEAVNLQPATGYEILKRPRVERALDIILKNRLDSALIDVSWLLDQAVDNHMLARQAGNLSASNKALELIGRISSVDAFAAKKIDLTVNEGVEARLRRGRERARSRTIDAEVIPSTPEKRAETVVIDIEPTPIPSFV